MFIKVEMKLEHLTFKNYNKFRQKYQNNDLIKINKINLILNN